MRPDALQNFGHVWSSAPYWDEEARVADAIEKLTVARAGGIETIVDPTVLGLGRYIPRILGCIADAAVETGTPVMVHTNSSAQTALPALEFLTGRGVDFTQMMVENPRRFLAAG